MCLSYENFKKIKKYCKRKNNFFSTPDGEESLNFLADKQYFKDKSGSSR